MNKYLLQFLMAYLALWGADAQAGMDDARANYDQGRYAEAMKEYETYAARGFGRANFMIATMLANGEGVPRDVVKAISHAKLAVERGAPEGMALIALLYESDHSGLKDEKSAIEWLQKGVEIGDANSIRILAHRYRHARGVPQDLNKTRALLEHAAKDDDFRSIYDLGQLYEHGLGVEPDEHAARRWYERLLMPPFRPMDKHYLELYVPLAGLMEKTPKKAGDLPNAADIFERAAEAGNVEAMYRLARMLELGRGRTANVELAATWYEKAADHGDGRALFRGGMLFREGRGVKQNRGEALNWFVEGAQRGNVRAMRAAGHLLDEGVNGVPDRVAALSWYCKAAVGEKSWQAPGAKVSYVTVKYLATLKRCINADNPMPAAQSLHAALAATLPITVLERAELLAKADLPISSIVEAEK